MTALLTWTLLACGEVDTSDGSAVDAEICTNGADDDGDGLVDCVDDDCAGSCPEICGNDLDDDGNGAIDCLDEACDGSCPEADACGDGRDNDGDLLTDCADTDCRTPDCPEDCTDTRDNDADGAIDCSDPDCNVESCAELCTDGRDNDADAAVDCDDEDCDGLCPEDCADGRDNDLDGFADCNDPQCEVACDEDCLDFADNDADDLVDCVDPECAASCDADLDGYLNETHGGDDCDDNDAAVHPDALEVCNGLDDDCNGLTDLDDLDLDATTLTKFYVDADGDTFGDYSLPGAWACVGDPGTAGNKLDCDDANPDISPLATEVCDGVDNDCDALRDGSDPSVDLSTAPLWYLDADGDGWGDPAVSTEACSQPVGYVDNDDDCDDADGGIGGALVDWYADTDGDGYGAEPSIVVACLAPAPDLVSNADDCDDTDAMVNPDATEMCNLVDENCDGLVDWDDPLNECTIDGDGIGATLIELESFHLDPTDIGFGSAMATAADVLVVGVPDGGSTLHGGALVYRDLGAGVWAAEALVSDATQTAADEFGAAVDTVGTLIAIGAPGGDDGGRVFIYEDDGLNWIQMAVLSDAGDLGDAFGAAVAFGSDDTLWVGAPGDDSADPDAGRVYKYVDNGATWALDAVFDEEVLDVDASALGASIDATGDFAVAGAAGGDGAACVIDAATDTMTCLGAHEPARTYGTDVAIHGDRLVVAAPGSGNAEVWSTDGATWTLDATLTLHEPTEGFPASVAFEGGRIVAGSPGEESSAHVFADVGNWVEAAWVLGSSTLPTDVLTIVGPTSASASNCIPFGDGSTFGDYMGFVYKNQPAFDLRPGDVIAWDLWAVNDVDINMEVAFASAKFSGSAEPDVAGFTTLAIGKPAVPRGNGISKDYELAWEVTNTFNFAGGGLIVRFKPIGTYATDASCTGVITATEATDPTGWFSSRFYSDPDGVFPWGGTDLSVIGVAQFTVSSSPTFGAAVDLHGDQVLIGAPGDAVDAVPGEVQTFVPTAVTPAW